MKRKSVYVIILLFAILACCRKKPGPAHEGHGDVHGTMLALTEQERLLANIHIDTARIKTIFEETTLVGTAVVDERNIGIISSRARGRVDKLFVRNPGTYVKNGDPLYSLYSEELLSYENEYLLAIDENKTATSQNDITRRMMEAARKRLELWTLTDRQISELEKERKISPLITFYSNRSGYLTELLVREGEYAEIGSPMFRLADFHNLWIESQFYSSEIGYLKQSPVVDVEFEAFPGERIKAEIVYDNPGLEENTKINLVRISINNRNGKYKPGMMAYVYLKRNRRETLVIPKSALLLEKFATVWIETPDGMFEQRMVNAGIGNKREVEILSGLSAGDRVVTSGAYLLNSAWKVKQGGGSMEGMDM